VGTLDDARLLTEMRLLGEPPAQRLRATAHVLGLGMLAFTRAERAFRDHPEARRLLAAGIPGNPTTEISFGIDELVAAARPLRDVFEETPGTDALLAGSGSARARPGSGPGRSGTLRPSWEFDLTVPLVRTDDDPGPGAGRPRGPASRDRGGRLERLAGKRAIAAAARRPLAAS
jgi:hypothetical protein